MSSIRLKSHTSGRTTSQGADHLSAKSALFNRKARDKKLRDHAIIVEQLSQPRHPARDPVRAQFAEALEAVEKANSALQNARLVYDKKRHEGYAANSAVEASKGNASLEEIERQHTAWVVAKELGEPVGPEPPSVEGVKAQIKAAEKDAEKIDAMRGRLEEEIKRREQALEKAQRLLKNAKAAVLKSAFVDLAAYYRNLQIHKYHVERHLSVLFSAALAALGPEHNGWDSIPILPREDTNALRDAVARLDRDPDATGVAEVVAALKRSS